MYTTETLRNLVKHYKNHMARIEAKAIRPIVHISRGNRKIGRVLNVSTVPIMDCQNCKECHKICYAVRSYVFHTNTCVPSWTDNSYLARHDRKLYFSEIRKACRNRKKNKYFRWHVSGEILDYDYFVEMVEIAKEFPDFVFWTYTKMYDIVNVYCFLHGDTKAAIPENLHIMFSEWRGMEMYNPYGFPEFRVVFEKDPVKPDPKKVWYCPGNCDICKEKSRGCVVGETTYCNEH